MQEMHIVNFKKSKIGWMDGSHMENVNSLPKKLWYSKIAGSRRQGRPKNMKERGFNRYQCYLEYGTEGKKQEIKQNGGEQYIKPGVNFYDNQIQNWEKESGIQFNTNNILYIKLKNLKDVREWILEKGNNGDGA